MARLDVRNLPDADRPSFVSPAAIEALLSTYPRVRSPLSPQWQAAYTSVYKASRRGENFLYRTTQQLESWMHRKVRGASAGERLLEIGAGTLNHLRYEAGAASYDVIEPFSALYEGQSETRLVRQFYTDIDEVPLDHRFDRILSVAVLEHLANLPHVVARAGLLLGDKGEFKAGIPSEGGLLWTFSWASSVGLMTRITRGLDYGELMRHEHLSAAPEIIAVVRYFFRNCRVERFPLPWHHLSLYCAISASDADLDRCAAFGR